MRSLTPPSSPPLRTLQRTSVLTSPASFGRTGSPTQSPEPLWFGEPIPFPTTQMRSAAQVQHLDKRPACQSIGSAERLRTSASASRLTTRSSSEWRLVVGPPLLWVPGDLLPFMSTASAAPGRTHPVRTPAPRPRRARVGRPQSATAPAAQTAFLAQTNYDHWLPAKGAQQQSLCRPPARQPSRQPNVRLLLLRRPGNTRPCLQAAASFIVPTV